MTNLRHIPWLSPAITFVLLAANRLALAHPGHGTSGADPQGPAHYLMEPAHLWPTAGAAVIIIALAAVWLRTRRRTEGR